MLIFTVDEIHHQSDCRIMGKHNGKERSSGSGRAQPAIRGDDPQLAALGTHLRPDEGPETTICHPL